MVSALKRQSQIVGITSSEVVATPKAITAIIETITPTIAKIYLVSQSTNRKLNLDRVHDYARQMLRGEWQVSSQGIAFDVNGKLIDGQHRLAAIMDAGIDIKLLVIRNCPAESQAVLDSGQPRTISQALNISGVSVSTLEASILRSMFVSLDVSESQARKISRTQMMEVLPKYSQSIRFAATCTGARAIKFAPIRSLVARAHACGVDVDRLSRFLYVLDTGFPEGSSDFPAIALRSYYTANRPTAANRPLVYAKAIYSLKNFLEFNTTKQLRLAKELPWKLEDFDSAL